MLFSENQEVSKAALLCIIVFLAVLLGITKRSWLVCLCPLVGLDWKQMWIENGQTHCKWSRVVLGRVSSIFCATNCPVIVPCSGLTVLIPTGPRSMRFHIWGSLRGEKAARRLGKEGRGWAYAQKICGRNLWPWSRGTLSNVLQWRERSTSGITANLSALLLSIGHVAHAP